VAAALRSLPSVNMGLGVGWDEASEAVGAGFLAAGIGGFLWAIVKSFG
jgi:hypothetical protein